ncbi:MAG: CCA tRNA nucleotidyltransferase [Hyphomicrobium sp.]
MISRKKGARRIDAPWLRAPALAKIFDALEAGGAEARVVGGAVRNALIGPPVGDIDLATTATPDETLRLAAAAGLRTYPSGIAHGTITVVADDRPFEVTTLRRDVETDGRRAVVAFTKDWSEDAARRDFTINGLFCRRDGVVIDTVGGLADIDARRVRFIGDPAARIREDFLRILRFFRFSAAYAEGELDRDGLSACIALRDGVTRLSGERIGAELIKMLLGRRAGEIASVMRAAGILELTIGCSGHPERLMRLEEIESALGDHPDALTRLAALAVEAAADAKPLAERLRLSNSEAVKLAATATQDPAFADPQNESAARVALYRMGADSYVRAVRYSWAKSGGPPSSKEWGALATLPQRWTAPGLPFSGKDVIALGIRPGPSVGAILSAFEDWWIAEDFPSNSSRLAAQLAELAKRD